MAVSLLTACAGEEQAPKLQLSRSPLTGAAAQPDGTLVSADPSTQDELIVRYRRPAAQRRAALPAGLSRVRRFANLGEIEHVRVPQGVGVQSAVQQLRNHPDVEYVEPNQIYSVSLTPNDPDYSRLWGLHNVGQTGGVTDIDVNAPEAWDVVTGSEQVVIGVIDTGVEYTHPDLIDNIWSNPAELAGIAGVDDDGNGFVDDLHGIDSANNDSDPRDDHYHGTHVSGTIAARGDNGIGVVGVAWRAKIVACKFLAANGFGTTAGALACLDYFAGLKNAGVNLVATNNSWGGGGASQALQDAIERHNSLGILFVAAAGNSGLNIDLSPSFPAAYPNTNIISVAALDAQGALASFSNFGASSVDLGAPGVDVYSLGLGGTYRSASGTSMAAPHVTGLVALQLASSPQLTAAEVKQKLMNEGVALPSLAGKTVSGMLARAPIPDTDRDGLPDAWETLHGFDLNDPSDAAQDPDADGLSNLGEYRSATDPRNADSDADSLSDGAEVNTHRTDPNKADTDDDGLTDGAEVNTHGTDPRKADTDDDGLRDGAELTQHHTNPLVADTDGDGFKDGAEVSFGTDPNDPDDFPDVLPLSNGDFERGDFTSWTVVRDVSFGVAPAVVQFDVDGDTLPNYAARFQAGCSTATAPCPSAPSSLSQTLVTGAGTLSVSADLAVVVPVFNGSGGTFTLRIDGSAVGVVEAGRQAAGTLRFKLTGAREVAAGAHEIRIEVGRIGAASVDTPLHYIDNIVARMGSEPVPAPQPPVAAFNSSCSVSQGCSFTDVSSDPDGIITAWAWDFGDGTSSSLQYPRHSFAASGTYNVTLTVTDYQGLTASVSHPVTVVIPQPPVANFTFSCTHLACTFSDSSTDSDGSITAWSWNFGDGTSSSLQNPAHTYAAPGSYSVTLTVTDSQSLSASVSRQVVAIAPPRPPLADFTASCTNLGCSFTDASTDPDGSITAWAWNFGDGTNSNQRNPSHTFAAPGTYTISLTVTDNSNLSATSARQVLAKNPPKPPVAAFSVVCASLECEFTNQSSDPDGSIVSSRWDFNDGTSSTLQSPRHTFAAAGGYIVTLTVTDSDGLTASTTNTAGVTGCYTATNSAHYTAGRATRTGFLFYTYNAAGTGNALGSGSTSTSLQGANGWFTLVSSCPAPLPPLPAPPSVGSFVASVVGSAVTIGGVASDPNNNISRVEVSIVSGSTTRRLTAGGTTSWSVYVTDLAPGSYSATAQAFDTTNLSSPPSSGVSFTIPTEQCFTALNTAHYSAGRATRRGFLLYTYNAVGSGETLGSGSASTSLRGVPGSWRLVSSCP